MKISTIAETAWHHDGDFEFMKQLVSSIATKTDADYIKFHITLDVDEYILPDHPGYEWVKKNIFSENEWSELIKIAVVNEKKPMLLFNDTKAIDFGMQFNPDLVEIHSVCLNDFNLLNHLRDNINNDISVVLGIGGSNLYEIENAIETINSENIVLMHGFQNYPTQYADINFSKIRKLIQLYSNFKHGYADHTAWDNKNNTIITLMGASLGTEFIEKHVTIKTGKGRTDWQAAISIEQFNTIKENLKIVEMASGNGLLNMNAGEKAYSTFGVMKKAGITKTHLYKGDILTSDSFGFKRTGQASDLSQLELLDLIGKVVLSELEPGTVINKKDIN